MIFVAAICYYERTVYVEDMANRMHGVAYCPTPEIAIWLARHLALANNTACIEMSYEPTDEGAWTE